MEKAHPRIFDVFLQVLEDGRLTDGKGRTVNFRNTVVLMTTNVGSQAIFEAGGAVDKAQDEIQRALRQYFRPEFINRLDEVVTFRALTEADMKAVAGIQMKRVAALLEAQHIGLEAPEPVLAWLGREGFDPQLGARPLKRLIQQAVVNRISRMILEGTVHAGEMVALAVDGDELEVAVEAVQ
jgi:ATP-dependent Clp protease ATP-binding subunit ClpA